MLSSGSLWFDCFATGDSGLPHFVCAEHCNRSECSCASLHQAVEHISILPLISYLDTADIRTAEVLRLYAQSLYEALIGQEMKSSRKPQLSDLGT